MFKMCHFSSVSVRVVWPVPMTSLVISNHDIMIS